jgi:hypothetical protein
VSFAAIALCAASERVFIVVSVYFIIESVQKLLDTPSYVFMAWCLVKHRDNFAFASPRMCGKVYVVGHSNILMPGVCTCNLSLHTLLR